MYIEDPCGKDIQAPVFRGRTKDSREDESVSVGPIWVLRVEGHAFVEKNMRDGCHAHWSSGMAGIGSNGRIDLCEKPWLAIDDSLLSKLVVVEDISTC